MCSGIQMVSVMITTFGICISLFSDWAYFCFHFESRGLYYEAGFEVSEVTSGLTLDHILQGYIAMVTSCFRAGYLHKIK